jgi:hypothetical protein
MNGRPKVVTTLDDLPPPLPLTSGQWDALFSIVHFFDCEIRLWSGNNDHSERTIADFYAFLIKEFYAGRLDLGSLRRRPERALALWAKEKWKKGEELRDYELKW